MTPGTAAAIAATFSARPFGAASISVSMVRRPICISRHGDKSGDAKRRQRVALRKAEMRGDKAGDRQKRGDHVARKMQRVGGQRLALRLLGDRFQRRQRTKSTRTEANKIPKTRGLASIRADGRRAGATLQQE